MSDPLSALLSAAAMNNLQNNFHQSKAALFHGPSLPPPHTSVAAANGKDLANYDQPDPTVSTASGTVKTTDRESVPKIRIPKRPHSSMISTTMSSNTPTPPPTATYSPIIKEERFTQPSQRLKSREAIVVHNPFVGGESGIPKRPTTSADAVASGHHHVADFPWLEDDATLEAQTKKAKRAAARKKRSMRGWCLTCNHVKELEERSSRCKTAKFQLCNACRKTHLTPRISTAYEQGIERWQDLGQQEATPITPAIVHANVIQDLKREFNNTRMTRILQLYLNEDKDTVPITYACDKSTRKLITVARSALAKLALPLSEEPCYIVEGIKIRGQPYRVYHARVPMSKFGAFKQTVQEEVAQILNPVVQEICAQSDYVQALARINVNPASVRVLPQDTQLTCML